MCQRASDGSEEAFVPTSNPTYLSPGVHQFTTITVPAGAVVYVAGMGPQAGTLDLRATGRIQVDGTIDVSGGPGSQAVVASRTTQQGHADTGGYTGELRSAAMPTTSREFDTGAPGPNGPTVVGASGSCAVVASTECLARGSDRVFIFTAAPAQYGGGAGVFSGYRAYGSGGGGGLGRIRISVTPSTCSLRGSLTPAPATGCTPSARDAWPRVRRRLSGLIGSRRATPPSSSLHQRDRWGDAMVSPSDGFPVPPPTRSTMSKKNWLAAALTAATLASAALPGVALAQHAAARITMDDARGRAQRAVPGTIIAQELEREHGRMIYSFEIRVSGAPATEITEVNIDAADGHVVAIEHEHVRAPARR
ncbi:MAG: hypothetical protein EPO40_02645 [Myxococcaceae bacterium]|nr:MAG: hypothetical protein EPO40_02645 [Myxococcaceae bacterium]